LDPRDIQTWVAIEITRQGEIKVEEGTFETLIRTDLGVGPEFPVFVPAHTYTRNERQVVIWLMDGYVFVGSGLPETAYFSLEHKPYVEKVVSTTGTKERLRSLQTIPDTAIQDLRRQLQKIRTADLTIGKQVRVLEGVFQGLDGEVIGVDQDQVHVKVELRSLKATISIPRVCVGDIPKNS